jgi:hypothetical protein
MVVSPGVAPTGLHFFSHHTPDLNHPNKPKSGLLGTPARVWANSFRALRRWNVVSGTLPFYTTNHFQFKKAAEQFPHLRPIFKSQDNCLHGSDSG